MTEPMSDKVTPELVEKLCDEECAICGKRRSQHHTGSGYGMCQVYPLFRSKHEMLTSLLKETNTATPLVKMREALEATKETLTLLNDRFEVHMGKRSAEIDILLTEIDAALSSNLEGG